MGSRKYAAQIDQLLINLTEKQEAFRNAEGEEAVNLRSAIDGLQSDLQYLEAQATQSAATPRVRKGTHTRAGTRLVGLPLRETPRLTSQNMSDNWLVPPEVLKNSPSRADAMREEDEKMVCGCAWVWVVVRVCVWVRRMRAYC